MRLREAMQEGEVRFNVRIDATGEYSEPLPGKWWNTEKWPARFYNCRLNTREPITNAVNGSGFDWIFVDGADLKALLTKLREAAAPKPMDPRTKNDDKSIEEMVAALDAGFASSPTAASKFVARGLKGEQSEAAAARRIYEKFKKLHPDRIRGYVSG